jgi:CHAT domain-containing protein
MTARLRLPPQIAVLYYAALDDRLLIWTLTGAAVEFIDTPVRHAELIHLLEQYRSEMAGNPADARDMPSLTRLYDVLIRPAASRLAPGAGIVVVPDGALNAVPFAALIKREDRRYLIEDHAIEVAPSLTVFLAASERPRTAGDASNEALVFGNPRSALDGAGATPDLPEAEAEARDIAALYPRAMVLVGAHATKSDFVANAARYRVVHFAGHAIANEARPELSRLLMAGPDEGARSLFARDISALRLDATELVVLGACRTSIGRIRRGEGVFNLARPFLAAGVPAVVASLWDVDDRASRTLLVAFHRALRRTGDVAGALRIAQLEMMGAADPRLQAPAAWAAFVVIGGRTAHPATAVSQPRQGDAL